MDLDREKGSKVMHLGKQNESKIDPITKIESNFKSEKKSLRVRLRDILRRS